MNLNHIHPLVKGALIAGGAIALTRLIKNSQKDHSPKTHTEGPQQGVKGGSASAQNNLSKTPRK